MFSGDMGRVNGGNGQLQLLISHQAALLLNPKLIKQRTGDTDPHRTGVAASCLRQNWASVEMSL